MEPGDLVSTHLPMAVVASIIIVIINVYSGETTTPIVIASEFLLHLLAIFVGFALVDGAWEAIFNERGS
jgi:hypothetical protein